MDNFCKLQIVNLMYGAAESVLGKERERHHPQRAGEDKGNEDGRLVRNAEGTLRNTMA